MKRANQKILLTFSLLFLLFSPSLWAATSTSNQQTSYLFIQQARAGKLVATSEPGTYKLIVRGLQPYVMYFTDRPSRTAGLVTTQDFYAQWNNKGKDGFQSDAPNAGLIGVKLHHMQVGKDNEIAITLANPQYNAKTNTVTYTAKILATDVPKLPASLKFSHLVLFFDGGPFCPTCIG